MLIDDYNVWRKHIDREEKMYYYMHMELVLEKVLLEFLLKMVPGYAYTHLDKNFY